MNRKGTPMSSRKSTRVDVHSHVIPAEMLQALEKDPERYQMRVDSTENKLVRPDGSALPLFKEFSDATTKVAGMDRKWLDVSLISPARYVLFYLLHAGRPLAAAGRYNHGHTRWAL